MKATFVAKSATKWAFMSAGVTRAYADLRCAARAAYADRRCAARAYVVTAYRAPGRIRLRPTAPGGRGMSAALRAEGCGARAGEPRGFLPLPFSCRQIDSGGVGLGVPVWLVLPVSA